MKSLFMAAAVMCMASFAFADEAKGPALMTDAEMDAVVGGDEIWIDGRLTTEINAELYELISSLSRAGVSEFDCTSTYCTWGRSVQIIHPSAG